MEIQTTIPDEQAAALAQAFHVTEYASGNDLILQVAEAALSRTVKQAFIGAVAASEQPEAVAAAVDAFNAVSSRPVRLPGGSSPAAGLRG